jgi:hypothetical protein
MTAGAVAADGEVRDQTHRHACIAGRVLGVREPLGGEPLQEQMKFDFVAVRVRKRFDLGAARIA